MAGYIGSKSSVTQVDGYTEAEAEAEFVAKTGGTMTGNLTAPQVEIGNGSAGGTSQILFSDNVSARGKILYDHSSNPETLLLQTTGTTAISVDNSQNVSIPNGNLLLSGNATFADNGKAIFGAGSDLQIYHDGTNSLLVNGAGDLEIRGAGAGVGNVLLRPKSGENGIIIKPDDAVLLYHNNSKKFETTSVGATVTGKLGIGTSSPSRNLTVSSSGQTDLAIIAASGSSAQLCFGDGDDDNVGQIEYSHPSDSMRFYTQATERMRLDSSGNLLVGKDTTNSGVNGTVLYNNGQIYSTATGHQVMLLSRYTNNGEIILFYRDGTNVGNIYVTTSSTSYNTSSDYRLKENVVNLTGASARVNQLNPSRFNFITDDTNTAVDGFLAHEVADVVPEAITGTKDAMKDEEYEVTPAVLDEDGNVTTEAVMGTRSVPDYQGIDQSKLVPLLTAALQEALTEIASLKTRVEALEA